MILARCKSQIVSPPITGWFPVKFDDREPLKWMRLTTPYTEEWMRHPAFCINLAINRILLEFKRD